MELANLRDSCAPVTQQIKKMASAGEGNQTESVVQNEGRNSLYKQARLTGFKKSLFNSPFSDPVSDTEPGKEFDQILLIFIQ